MAGFVAGVACFKAVLDMSGREIVQNNTYILKDDCREQADESFHSQFKFLVDQNAAYKTAVEELQTRVGMVESPEGGRSKRNLELVAQQKPTDEERKEEVVSKIREYINSLNEKWGAKHAYGYFSDRYSASFDDYSRQYSFWGKGEIKEIEGVELRDATANVRIKLVAVSVDGKAAPKEYNVSVVLSYVGDSWLIDSWN